jgi:sugar transferase (PEP-CTERM/EpsH1 system associated)
MSFSPVHQVPRRADQGISGRSPTPIRVFHVIETLLGMGGMEKGVANVIQGLDPERFQHVVCVIRSLGILAGCFPPDRAKLICLEQIDCRRSFQAGRLAREIQATQPDIIHSRNWGAIETVLAGKWTRSAAMVHSEHGMESADVYPLRRRCFRRLAFEMVDRVVTVSYNLRDLHAQRTGFPAKRISVIHNGVDTDRFRQNASVRAEARQSLGMGPQDFCIGTVGRLEPVKDLLTLFRAAAEMARAGEDFHVFLAGDGSELPVLRGSLRDFPQLERRVHFLGEIQDTPNFLNALDVFVLSSLFEGISNSLLEAMATRLPVIVTLTGGNPEVVVNGTSGLMFPVGNFQLLAAHLKSLAQVRDLRERLATQALQRVREHFSLNSMVQGYERLYTSLAPKNM